MPKPKAPKTPPHDPRILARCPKCRSNEPVVHGKIKAHTRTGSTGRYQTRCEGSGQPAGPAIADWCAWRAHIAQVPLDRDATERLKASDALARAQRTYSDAIATLDVSRLKAREELEAIAAYRAAHPSPEGEAPAGTPA